jgi:small subunit ribosomal protein S9
MPKKKEIETTEENAEEKVEVKKEEKNVMQVKTGFISGTGRRKTAVARVFLYKKKGNFFVNNMPIEAYFPTENEKLEWARPFHTVGVSHPESQYSGTIKVHGSSKPSQLGAVSLGISRALASIDEEYGKSLRKQGLLTRDSRMVERKKPYLRKARKGPQYSKR